MPHQDPPDPNAGKRAALEQLLDQGMVLVTLDARVEGVRVPPAHADDPQLRLNLSYRFGLPMESNDDGVTATLTFGGVPFECHMPWRSIYMLVSHVTGQPFLFPADIPEDIRKAMGELAAEDEAEHHPQHEPGRGSSGPRLQVIKNVAPVPSDPARRDDSDPSAPSEEPEGAPPEHPDGAPAPSSSDGPGAEADDGPEDPSPDGPTRPKKARRGHLRVVK